MFCFFFLLGICHCDDTIKRNESTGKHTEFTKVVEESTELEIVNSSKKYFEIMNEITFPSPSCYTEIINKLNYDCEMANETQQKYLAIQFTQCFYNITGRLDLFPTDVADEQKTSKMSNSVYSTYTIMKVHWKNLCMFSKQNAFNEETSRALYDLYQSMNESINSISNIRREIANISKALNQTITQINIQLENTSKLLGNMEIFVNNFGSNFDLINNFIESAILIAQKVKIYIVIAIFVYIVFPKLLVPILLFTSLVLYLDNVAESYYNGWNTSLIRIVLKYGYFGFCFGFPIYKLYSFLMKIKKVEDNIK